MYIDTHVHLQPHGEKPPVTRERIEQYVEAGRERGVERIAFTEHLFRFQEAYDLLRGWADDDPRADLVACQDAYWQDHVSMTVADYVREIEAAKAAGLPVLLGLEMDWLHDRGDALRRFLAPYDWDIILGSVHWIGPWCIDTSSAPDFEEWGKHPVDETFAEYAGLLEELAAAGLCDVLAHPDLPKIHGHRPTSPTPLHERIIGAATSGGCAIELNSNGWNKPVAEAYPAPALLERARAARLPITFASDAHVPERVGEQFDGLSALAASAGYETFTSYEARKPSSHPLPSAAK